MWLRLPIATLALVVASATAQAHDLYVSGTIGGFPVMLTLERDGAKLSGWYFYLRRGQQLHLQGAIDAKGNFQLTEYDTEHNAKTGTFNGTVTQGLWTGNWTSAKGGAALPLALHENRDMLAGLNGSVDCTAKTPMQGYTFTHSISFAAKQGRITKLELNRDATSSDGDDQSCSIGISDLKQVPSDAGILLRANGDTPKANDSGMHCSVRIIGEGSFLYVQMGEGSENGNDCRGTDEQMFCSARANWTDFVVDRKTRRCVSVE